MNERTDERVRVSREVIAGLEAVRRSGLVNMFDRPSVIEIAEMFGHDETAQWCRENKHRYGQLIIHGPAVDESE